MADEKNTGEVDPNEGPGKGKQFFDRAKTVADTGNFDYAIEMYIQGLYKEPFNVEAHQALRNVAFHRKVAGGKPGGGLFGPKMPFKGKTPKEAMLNSEFKLARDVGSIPDMQTIFRNADILGLKDVVAWIGPILKEANRTSKQPKLELFLEIAEIFDKHNEYAKACEAINDALMLKPGDMELSTLLGQYAAKATIQRGRYEEEGDFKKMIKDKDVTKDLAQEDSLIKSEDYLMKVLAQAKADYEKNPKELQVISKYYKALTDTEMEEHENTAIEILNKAYADTKIYRLKAQADDVRIKQLKRNQRVLQDALKDDPSDKDTAELLEQVKRDRLAFELDTFKDRAEHMPMDLSVKYEYGMRLWEAKRYDDALVALQEAQQNPKHRVEALHYLGRAFFELGMYPEAVDTAQRSLEEYDMAASGDTKSMTLHYWYARSLEANRQLKEAIDIYSKIIRWKIDFMDSRKRLMDLRSKLDAA